MGVWLYDCMAVWCMVVWVYGCMGDCCQLASPVKLGPSLTGEAARLLGDRLQEARGETLPTLSHPIPVSLWDPQFHTYHIIPTVPYTV